MRPTNIDLDKKMDKEVFYDKYELLLQYIDDIKGNKKLLEDRLFRLENKPKNNTNKFLLYYNIGSIIVNLVILIKLFL